LKKSDFSTPLTILLLLLCFISILLAMKFEMVLNEKMFTIYIGLFMVFFGVLLSLVTKIKWTEYAQRREK
jgi:hypothetical protein